MTDPLEQVLRLVAEGRLTAAEAEPILDALGADIHHRDDEPSAEPNGSTGSTDSGAGDRKQPVGGASSLRIEVTEAGRRVVNLRIPVPLGRLALDRIPGLSESNVALVREALSERRIGTLLVVDDEDGDGVRIALE